MGRNHTNTSNPADVLASQDSHSRLRDVQSVTEIHLRLSRRSTPADWCGRAYGSRGVVHGCEWVYTGGEAAGASGRAGRRRPARGGGARACDGSIISVIMYECDRERVFL